MAYLSLITALILFFIALSRESKKIKVMTWTLAIPYCWLMIALSRSVNRWMNIGKSGSVVEEASDAIQAGSTIDSVVFSLFFIICLIILFKRKEIVFDIFRNNKAWLILYIYCALSVFWSDFALTSTKRFIKDSNTLLMALVVLTEPKPIEAFKAIVRRNMYLLVPLSIVFCKYFPHIGRHQHHSGTFTYAGVTTGKNPLGMLCLIGGMVFILDIWTTWRNRHESHNKDLFYLHCFYLILIMYLFSLADSTTSLTCFILGTTIMVSPFLKNHLTKILIIGIVFYSTELGTFLYNSLESLFLGVAGKDATLTGRADLWAAVISMKFNHLVGTGYNSFWLGDRLVELWNAFSFRPKQAHNGYIEVYLNLGIIGLALLVIALLSSFKKLKYNLSQERAFWSFQISFFVIYLIHNITEATFIFNLSPLWFVFLFTVLANRRG